MYDGCQFHLSIHIQLSSKGTHLMSRFSFCVSSFGALIDQSVAAGEIFTIVSNLTSKYHPCKHDSDGHFQLDIRLSRNQARTYLQHYLRRSAAASGFWVAFHPRAVGSLHFERARRATLAALSPRVSLPASQKMESQRPYRSDNIRTTNHRDVVE